MWKIIDATNPNTGEIIFLGELNTKVSAETKKFIKNFVQHFQSKRAGLINNFKNSREAEKLKKLGSERSDISKNGRVQGLTDNEIYRRNRLKFENLNEKIDELYKRLKQGLIRGVYGEFCEYIKANQGKSVGARFLYLAFAKAYSKTRSNLALYYARRIANIIEIIATYPNLGINSRPTASRIRCVGSDIHYDLVIRDKILTPREYNTICTDVLKDEKVVNASARQTRKKAAAKKRKTRAARAPVADKKMPPKTADKAGTKETFENGGRKPYRAEGERGPKTRWLREFFKPMKW